MRSCELSAKRPPCPFSINTNTIYHNQRPLLIATRTTMPNIYPRKSKEAATMPRRPNKPDGKCRKHPKHRQSPGVCSLCLSEKLSQLSSTSSRTTTTSSTMDYSSSSSSLSSYYSSSSCSSCSSPMHRFGYGKTEGKGSLRLLLLSGKNIMLTKSRSLAFVPRMRGKNTNNNNNNNKENFGDVDKRKTGGGFWSKLVRPRNNKRFEEGLVHSTTMRERVIIAAH